MTALECKVPLGVKLISAGIDFQIDRAELEFVGWGVGEETWGLGNLMFPGDFTQMQSPGRPWAYDQLEAALAREFVREDGARLKVVAAGFDTGYATAQRALYQYLRPRFVRRFYALKGAAMKWAPTWAKGRRDERVTLFVIGTNRIKKFIYQRATISTPGPGYMHIPKTDDYDEHWFKQLLAEDSHDEFLNGQQVTVFEMPTQIAEDGTDRNEALDKRVYAQAALYIRGVINWEFEEKKNLATIPVSENERDSRPKQPQRRPRRSGWMQW